MQKLLHTHETFCPAKKSNVCHVIWTN
uniref:Uncharacterized protein n=1 Tax=Arundo donax TaxID=35708 RepID=A0A0A9HC74_ARUDO